MRLPLCAGHRTLYTHLLGELFCVTKGGRLKLMRKFYTKQKTSALPKRIKPFYNKE
jgi:hypothetical protein